jgi:hypothetical protein
MIPIRNYGILKSMSKKVSLSLALLEGENHNICRALVQSHHLLIYTKPPMRQMQRRPTATTASGLIGARPFHQPVLSIQVYIVEWPFSCSNITSILLFEQACNASKEAK